MLWAVRLILNRCVQDMQAEQPANAKAAASQDHDQHNAYKQSYALQEESDKHVHRKVLYACVGHSSIATEHMHHTMSRIEAHADHPDHPS